MPAGYQQGEPDRFSPFTAGAAAPPPTWQSGEPGGFGQPYGGGEYSGAGLGPVEPDGTETAPKQRKGLIIGLVVAILVVLGAGGVSVVMFMNRSGDSFTVGSCVKQSDGSAITAECSDKNAFRIVRKVSDQTNCPDQAQPFVVIERDGGKDDVFCLRPADAD
jgi:hypothetical protein